MNDPFRPDGPSVVVNLSAPVRKRVAEMLADGVRQGGDTIDAGLSVDSTLFAVLSAAADQQSRARRIGRSVTFGVGDVTAVVYRTERAGDVTVSAAEAVKVRREHGDPLPAVDDPIDPRAMVRRVAAVRFDRARRIEGCALLALGQPVAAAAVAELDDQARQHVGVAEGDGDAAEAEFWWQVRAELDGWAG